MLVWSQLYLVNIRMFLKYLPTVEEFKAHQSVIALTVHPRYHFQNYPGLKEGSYYNATLILPSVEVSLLEHEVDIKLLRYYYAAGMGLLLRIVCR